METYKFIGLKDKQISFPFTEAFLLDSKDIKKDVKKIKLKIKLIAIFQLLLIIIACLFGYLYAKNNNSNIYLIIFCSIVLINEIINRFRKKHVTKIENDSDTKILFRKFKYIRLKEYLDNLVKKKVTEIEFDTKDNILRLSYKYENKKYHYIIDYPIIKNNDIDIQDDNITKLVLVDKSDGQLDFAVNILSKINNDSLKGKYKIIKE